MSFTLITAATSSRAYKISAKLAGNNIILGDYEDLPELLTQNGKIIKLPHPQQASYAHRILTLCLDKDISVVCPLTEDELALLKEAVQLFREFNITIKQPDEI